MWREKLLCNFDMITENNKRRALCKEKSQLAFLEKLPVQDRPSEQPTSKEFIGKFKFFFPFLSSLFFFILLLVLRLSFVLLRSDRICKLLLRQWREKSKSNSFKSNIVLSVLTRFHAWSQYTHSLRTKEIRLRLLIETTYLQLMGKKLLNSLVLT